MATLLMRTGGAEPAEVDGMMDVLLEHEIACYTTESGRWGLGVNALWLADDTNLNEARRLIAVFQEGYATKMKAAYKALEEEGVAPSFLSRLWAQPGVALLTLVALGIVILVSLVPFFWF